MSLSTGFVKVAQSGQTIDGREIKPEWLLQAAELYSKTRYVANIYPEHNETLPSYGTVEELRSEKAGDKVDLYARLSPNVNWIIDVQKGDKLFTSVALMPNFENSGQMYLYSLAATNNPASIGVEQLKFSKKEIEISDSLETHYSNDAEALSFARRLFNFFKSEDNEMSPADKDALKVAEEKISALETRYSAFIAKENGVDKTAQTAEQFAALQTENAQLKTKVSELETKVSEFSKLKDDFEAHKLEFAKAIKEEIPGTDAKKHSVPVSEFSIEHEI